MYYDEKFIEGIIHIRRHPKGKWKKMSLEQMDRKIEELDKELEQLENRR